jgi:formate hydrogenlyase transcriptional activator
VVTLTVSEAIISLRDLAALFRKLASALHRVARFDYLGLYLHEAANNALRLHVLEPDEPNVSGAGLPLGETPPEWVLQTKAERA